MYLEMILTKSSPGDMQSERATTAHWEELLQSVSNFIFRLTISKHCGRTPRCVRGVKRSEIL